jgi:hypothetical protein
MMKTEDNHKSAQPLLNRRHLLQALAALPIAACSTSPVLTTALQNARVAAVGFPDAPVTRAQVEASPYASVYARIGKGPRSLLVLAETDGAELRWLSADRAMLVTERGRIIKTAGLGKDLTATRFPRGDRLGERPAQLNGATMNRLLDFQSRFQYGVQVISRFAVAGPEQITILDRTHDTVRVIEKSHCEQLDWSFENTWWLDPATGFVWQSRQWVTLDAPVFEVAVLKPAGA